MPLPSRLPLLALSLLACSAPGPAAPALPVVREVASVSPAPSVAVAPGESAEPPPSEPAVAAEPPIPTEALTLDNARDRVIEVLPPVTASRDGGWPLVVALHATCMQPGPVCNAFGRAGRDVGWLVCPAGNSACAGEPDWNGPGPTKASFLDQALRRVDERLGAQVASRPGVLVGWSRGAYAARDIVNAMVAGKAPDTLQKRFVGLVLLAASVTFDPEHLRAVGIERVVLAAGDHDGARGAMEAHTKALGRAGITARYVSLGKIGHWWPDDFEARMAAPIAWASGRREVPDF